MAFSVMYDTVKSGGLTVYLRGHSPVGGGALIFSYIRSHFWGFKILNFNILYFYAF